MGKHSGWQRFLSDKWHDKVAWTTANREPTIKTIRVKMPNRKYLISVTMTIMCREDDKKWAYGALDYHNAIEERKITLNIIKCGSNHMASTRRALIFTAIYDDTISTKFMVKCLYSSMFVQEPLACLCLCFLVGWLAGWLAGFFGRQCCLCNSNGRYERCLKNKEKK